MFLGTDRCRAALCYPGIMKGRFGKRLELRRSAQAFGAAARRLDAQADALWQLAADSDRWGLIDDAGEARKRACEMRVQALISQARAFALNAMLAGDPGPAS